MVEQNKSRSKSFAERRNELIGAITIIDKAIRQYEDDGEGVMLRVVATQLRALVVRVENSGSLNHPLLLDLAEERNFPLIVYVSNPTFYETMKQIIGEPTFYSTGDHLSINKSDIPMAVETTLESAMEMAHINLGPGSDTLKSIIRMVADKEAVHYDINQPAKFDTLNMVQLGGLPAVYRTIYITGKAVRDLGFQFISATA